MASDNNRVFYAIQAVGFAPLAEVSGYQTAYGVQSIGLNTTFNLEQVFELGQLELYENIEGIPDIEVTAQKVLDGYPLLYHLATPGAAAASLVGRSNERSTMALAIFPDTQDNASGTPESVVRMSGLYVSALTYTLNVDGNATEDLTLVGNDKVWSSGAPWYFTPAGFDGDHEPLSLATSGGVQRREDVLMGSGASGSLWPTEVPGIDVNGYNLESGDSYNAHIQTVTISTDLGRDELFELGRRGPYYRYVSFPVEVTCSIEITTSKGDFVDAEAEPVGGTNLTDQTIDIRMREGARFNLGSKNKLDSITYGGGDTGGGNATVTYNYSNFNSLTVTHPQDPAGV